MRKLLVAAGFDVTVCDDGQFAVEAWAADRAHNSPRAVARTLASSFVRSALRQGCRL